MWGLTTVHAIPALPRCVARIVHYPAGSIGQREHGLTGVIDSEDKACLLWTQACNEPSGGVRGTLR
jgi:hypothetical protein